MAGDHRSPGADVVDVTLALGIDKVRAIRGSNEAWRAADGAKCANRRIDAAGNGFLRAFAQRCGTRHVAGDCESADGKGDYKGCAPACLTIVRPLRAPPPRYGHCPTPP